MEIDFRKLLREEKRKQREQHQQQQKKKSNDRDSGEDNASEPIVVVGKTTKATAMTAAAVPVLHRWSHPIGFLSMERLELKAVCTNPQTIYYSETTFRDIVGGDTVIASSAQGPAQKSALSSLEYWLCHGIPSGESGLCEWKTMKYGKRRVCMFGEEREGSDFQALPQPLEEIAQQLVDLGIFASHERPNHVLLNEYQPGQGILAHTDGPSYASRTATLSLCSSVVVEFTKRLSPDQIGLPRQEQHKYPTISVLLDPGSLLVFEDDAYLNYCHSIATDVLEDTVQYHCVNGKEGTVIPRQKRFSLTFRHKRRSNNRK